MSEVNHRFERDPFSAGCAHRATDHSGCRFTEAEHELKAHPFLCYCVDCTKRTESAKNFRRSLVSDGFRLRG